MCEIKLLCKKNLNQKICQKNRPFLGGVNWQLSHNLLDVHQCNEDVRSFAGLCKWEGKTVAIVDVFLDEFLKEVQLQ
jgi:hypothetical protein